MSKNIQYEVRILAKINVLEDNFQLSDMDTKVFAYGFVTTSLAVSVMENFLGRYGLSMGEFSMLWHLKGAKNELNLKQVKENTLIYSGASITKVADKLVHKGFITRRENPASRREKLVKITPSGSKLCGKVLGDSKKVYAGFFKGLSGTDKRSLLDYYKTVFVNVLGFQGEG